MTPADAPCQIVGSLSVHRYKQTAVASWWGHCARSLVRQDDPDGLVAGDDDFAAPQLPAAAYLDVTVDHDTARREQGLGLGASLDQAGQLEELTQPYAAFAQQHLAHRCLELADQLVGRAHNVRLEPACRQKGPGRRVAGRGDQPTGPARPAGIGEGLREAAANTLPAKVRVHDQVDEAQQPRYVAARHPAAEREALQLPPLAGDGDHEQRVPGTEPACYLGSPARRGACSGGGQRCPPHLESCGHIVTARDPGLHDRHGSGARLRPTSSSRPRRGLARLRR